MQFFSTEYAKSQFSIGENNLPYYLTYWGRESSRAILKIFPHDLIKHCTSYLFDIL